MRGERAAATIVTMSSTKQVLVVAHRTAPTPKLLEHVRQRAQQEPCSFVLLVPRPYWDPDTEEAAMVIELALPLLERAAGGPVEAVVGDPDPFLAVRAMLERSHFDEVIISTLPHRVSGWLRIGLPDRIAHLGVPVTVVTATESERAWGS